MPPGVAVGPASSIASGYAACSVINTSGPQDHQQKALLRGNYPENMDSHVMGIGSSSSSTSSTSSRSSSSSSGESAELSDKDQLQVQSCYKGLKTQVYVCGSMANLYAHNPSAPSAEGGGGGGGGWELKHTGIPVVLYDSGETRSRDRPCIQILLVERGTCFALWRDTIDNLTAYKVSSQGFHTMCLSTDHTRLIGLSFDCADAAHRLWSHIDRLASDPENIRLSGPGGHRSKNGRRAQPKHRLPDKSHISQPCCFEHVTNVEASDRSRYLSLQNLVPAAPRTTTTTPDAEIAAAAAAAAVAVEP